MLMPRKVKHRKQQRGRMTGASQGWGPRSISVTSGFRPWNPAGSPPARSRPPESP